MTAEFEAVKQRDLLELLKTQPGLKAEDARIEARLIQFEKDFKRIKGLESENDKLRNDLQWK